MTEPHYGKYYLEGKLAYEGEWKAGTWDGQGKTYNNGKIVYEGEHKDGKATGRGRHYENGKFVNKDEFVNGKYDFSLKCPKCGSKNIKEEKIRDHIYRANFFGSLLYGPSALLGFLWADRYAKKKKICGDCEYYWR